MARVLLGARLVEAGLATPAEIGAALGAQKTRGARLGSLLVERFGLDVDALAQVLAQQLEVNAALRKHFDRAGASALERIPRKVAELYGAIPLGFSLKQAGTLIVAMVDPHDLAALETLRFTCRARILPSVAAELEIAQRLRALYGTAPGWHLPRGRGRAASALATTTLRQGNAPLTVHPEPLAELQIESLHESPSLPPVRSATSEASPPRKVIAPPALELEPPPSARRATLAMPTEPPVEPIAPVAPVAPVASVAPMLPSEPAISLDELHIPSQLPAAEVPTGFASEPAVSLDELRVPSELPEEAALGRRSLRIPLGAARKPGKSERPRPTTSHALEVAMRALSSLTLRGDLDDTLGDYLRSAHGIGVVFNVRGDAAHEWRGAAAGLRGPDGPDDDATTSEPLVVPLEVPSLLHRAHRERAVMFGAPPRAGASVQDALYRHLGVDAPTEALAAPIVLGPRVVKLLYAQRTDGGAFDDDAIDEITRLCEAASAALVRSMLKRPG